MPIIRLNKSVAEFFGVSTLSLGLTLCLLACTLRMVPGSVDQAKPWDHQRHIQMALHGQSARADAPFACGLPSHSWQERFLSAWN